MAKTTHREVEDDPIDYEIICPGNERTSFSRQHHLRAIALYNHTVPHSYRLVLCAKMDYLERLIGIAMPNFSGQNFREEQVEEIGLKWLERWCDLCTQFSNSCDVVRRPCLVSSTSSAHDSRENNLTCMKFICKTFSRMGVIFHDESNDSN